MCAMCASLCTTVVYNSLQHRAVLIIFPPNLQTIIRAQMRWIS